jgi:hypothetical protein
MRNPLSHVGSLDFWFEIAAIFGLLGIVIGVIGLTLGVRWLVTMGVCFALPLLFGLGVLVFVLIPIVVVANWKARRN